MNYQVEYSLVDGNTVTQVFKGQTLEQVRHAVIDLLKENNFAHVSPGEYGSMFGEVFIKPDKGSKLQDFQYSGIILSSHIHSSVAFSFVQIPHHRRCFS